MGYLLQMLLYNLLSIFWCMVFDLWFFTLSNLRAFNLAEQAAVKITAVSHLGIVSLSLQLFFLSWVVNLQKQLLHKVCSYFSFLVINNFYLLSVSCHSFIIVFYSFTRLILRL